MHPIVLLQRHGGPGEEILFIPEDDGADTRKTRLDVIDNRLYMFGIGGKGFIDQWSGTDDAHITDEDINQLGQFVDFCLSNEMHLLKSDIFIKGRFCKCYPDDQHQQNRQYHLLF